MGGAGEIRLLFSESRDMPIEMMAEQRRLIDGVWPPWMLLTLPALPEKYALMHRRRRLRIHHAIEALFRPLTAEPCGRGDT